MNQSVTFLADDGWGSKKVPLVFGLVRGFDVLKFWFATYRIAWAPGASSAL